MFFSANRTDGTQICLDHIFDSLNGISWKAKGILFLIIARDPDWRPTLKKLSAYASDGQCSIDNGLEELERNGVLERQSLRDEKGQFIAERWTITLPDPENESEPITIERPENLEMLTSER